MRPLVLLAVVLGPSLFFLLLPSGSPTIHGHVRDAHGRIPKAAVGVQGDASRTYSGPLGDFHLRSPTKGRLIAAKPGYRIAYADVVRSQLFLQPLPREDNVDYAWIDPTPNFARERQCGNCHGDIFREWAGSAHARSASNPRFLDLFGGHEKTWNLRAEYPEGAGVCASCHAPTMRSPSLDYDVRQAEGVARQGVHCDYCHKIVAAPLDKLGTRFGRDGLELLRPAQDDLLFFGPLDDAVRPGESFGHAPLYQDSAYCASCHEGTVFGVHVYGTYSEWRASPLGKKGVHCQACHMRPTGTMTNIAPGKGGIERNPWSLASHAFPGATQAMLRRCVRLEVTTETQGANTLVKVALHVGDVGHRVPTGFIDRHLLLVVETKNPLVEGPVLDSAAGQLRGKPGRIYAKVLRDDKGRSPLPFWKPHETMTDHRLQPNQTQREQFLFQGDATVQVRLIHRRFWDEVARARGWDDNDTIVAEGSSSQ